MLFRSKNTICWGAGSIIGACFLAILNHLDPNNSDSTLAFKLGMSVLAALGGGITPRINEFFHAPEVNDLRSMN